MATCPHAAQVNHFTYSIIGWFFLQNCRRKRKDNIYVLLTNPPSLLQHRKVCPQSSRSLISVTTPLQNTLRTLQNGLYFVNIYRNITDINFTPVTYVYTVQMQQKKKKTKLKNPILRPETSLRQNKAPVSDKLQQCRKKVYAGGFPVRIPGTVETTTEQNGRCQPQPNWIKLPCTQPHLWRSCAWGC